MDEVIILKDREGMVVYQQNDQVVKLSKDQANEEALANAYRFYRALEDTQYVPKLIKYAPGEITREYIVETPVTDTEAARRNVARLLLTLRSLHIIHGDLTAPNFIFRDNVPVVYDWDQAIFTHEPKPQKRPKPDPAHIWPAVVTKAGDPSRVIQRWLACMPHLEYYFGWGSLLDLGTHMGDFVGLAAAHGMKGLGVDDEYIRPCIQTATELWGEYGCAFQKTDIYDFLSNSHHFDCIMLFSTWPYIIQQRGIQAAEEVLRACVENSSVFLFETQYAGDGPGPEFLTDDESALAYLSQFAKVEKVVTIPVVGRDASRTVWKMEK